jgi:arabinose-5-phosphate isomerase
MNGYNEQIRTMVIEDTKKCLDVLTTEESMETMEKLADCLSKSLHNEEKIYITGIGKPGYIAMKQAAMLKSIRVDAEFLDATLAGHGDLGPMPDYDDCLLIAMSKSGGSSELYNLFENVKVLRPRCRVVMVCMSNDDQIKKVEACEFIDVIARFKCEPKELDGYGIVPATSNALFEVIMDTAVSMASEATFGFRNVCERLQQSHPSGTLHDKVTALLTAMK